MANGPIVTYLQSIKVATQDRVLAQEGALYLRSITAKKTGNARSKTGSFGGRSIRATYPYYGELDSGKSKQRPSPYKGVYEAYSSNKDYTKRTILFLQNYIADINKKAVDKARSKPSLITRIIRFFSRG